MPQFFNCDSIGYRYDLTGEDITSWGALLDPKYAGKVGILNDSLLTPGWCAGYLKKNGQMEIARTDNMTPRRARQVIDFLIERKRAGQFRAIWEDYGQCVNLLASGEVWLADAWNPVVEDVKKQDVVCKYAFPKEGFTAWFHGIAVQRTPRTSRRRSTTSTSVSRDGGVLRWPRRATTRRRRPATSTCKDSFKTDPEEFTDYEWWYQGGSSPEPKEGWPIRPAATLARTTSAGATSCTG